MGRPSGPSAIRAQLENRSMASLVFSYSNMSNSDTHRISAMDPLDCRVLRIHHVDVEEKLMMTFGLTAVNVDLRVK